MSKRFKHMLPFTRGLGWLSESTWWYTACNATSRCSSGFHGFQNTYGTHKLMQADTHNHRNRDRERETKSVHLGSSSVSQTSWEEQKTQEGHTPIIPTSWSKRLEDPKSKASLDYIVRTWLNISLTKK